MTTPTGAPAPPALPFILPVVLVPPKAVEAPTKTAPVKPPVITSKELVAIVGDSYLAPLLAWAWKLKYPASNVAVYSQSGATSEVIALDRKCLDYVETLLGDRRLLGDDAVYCDSFDTSVKSDAYCAAAPGDDAILATVRHDILRSNLILKCKEYNVNVYDTGIQAKVTEGHITNFLNSSGSVNTSYATLQRVLILTDPVHELVKFQTGKPAKVPSYFPTVVARGQAETPLYLEWTAKDVPVVANPSPKVFPSGTQNRIQTHTIPPASKAPTPNVVDVQVRLRLTQDELSIMQTSAGTSDLGPSAFAEGIGARLDEVYFAIDLPVPSTTGASPKFRTVTESIAAVQPTTFLHGAAAVLLTGRCLWRQLRNPEWSAIPQHFQLESLVNILEAPSLTRLPSEHTYAGYTTSEVTLLSASNAAIQDRVRAHFRSFDNVEKKVVNETCDPLGTPRSTWCKLFPSATLLTAKSVQTEDILYSQLYGKEAEPTRKLEPGAPAVTGEPVRAPLVSAEKTQPFQPGSPQVEGQPATAPSLPEVSPTPAKLAEPILASPAAPTPVPSAPPAPPATSGGYYYYYPQPPSQSFVLHSK